MSPARPVLRCPRAPAGWRIDGDLAKELWRTCPARDLADVATGAPPAQGTTVRTRWDDTHLLVAFSAVDDDIWGTYREHDDPLYEEEVVEVFLDPAGTGGTYFEFEVSPHGVTFDALVVNRARPGEPARDLTTLPAWDCAGWEVAVRVRGELDTRRRVSEGWDVEMAIPLRALAPPRLPPRPGDRWGANFFRIDRGADGDEYSAFAPTGKVDFHVPGSLGVLEFA